MEREEVVETLQSLASGAAVEEARIVEALETAVRLLGRRGAERDLPPATGARWTAEEEERLVRAFDEGASIASIAAAHGRKVGGIRARLIKLGRIEPPGVAGAREGGGAEGGAGGTGRAGGAGGGAAGATA
jgi:hypothetical protein